MKALWPRTRGHIVSPCGQTPCLLAAHRRLHTRPARAAQRAASDGRDEAVVLTQARTRGASRWKRKQNEGDANSDTHSGTDALNQAILAAMHEQAAGELEHVVQMLQNTKVPFNSTTLASSLELTLHMSHAKPRAKLAFAVRMLQRTRENNVVLERHSVKRLLALADQCNKLNAILAVNRLLEAPPNDPGQSLSGHQSASSHDSAPEHFRSVESQFSVFDVHAFYDDLGSFMRTRNREAATALWGKYRTHAFGAAKSSRLKAKLLNTGAWLCCMSNDAVMAGWVARMYKELCITPDSRTLGLLSSTFIHAEQFETARAHMRWMIRLGYALPERELHYYISASLEAMDNLDQVLLPLGEVLLSTASLCSSERERLRVVRSFCQAFSKGVLDGRLKGTRARDASECAQRVFSHWKIQDSVSWSFLVYLASRAERLDEALRMARDCHNHTSRDTSTMTEEHGTMDAFAYEALAQQGIKENRVSAVLGLLRAEDDCSTPVTAELASFVTASFISAFGRLGRLDLCTEVFEYFSKSHNVHVGVWTAYMYVLGIAGRPTEAINLFRTLKAAEGSSDVSGPNEVTYSVLGKVVLEGMRSNKDMMRRKARLSFDVVLEMLRYMEDFLRPVDMEDFLSHLQEDDTDEISSPRVEVPITNEADELGRGELYTDGSAARTRRPLCDPDKHERMQRSDTIGRIKEKVGWIREKLEEENIRMPLSSANPKEDWPAAETDKLKRAAALSGLWKHHRIHTFSVSLRASLIARFLALGASICAASHDVDGADWIARKYEELNITPDSRTLGLLVSTNTQAKRFDVARAHMRWMCRLGYTVHGGELRQYLSVCMRDESEELSLHEILLPLADILVSEPAVCHTDKHRLRLLREYFKALDTGVSDTRLAAHVCGTAECARRVFDHWKIQDNSISKRMASLDARAGQLNSAQHAAQVSQLEAPRASLV
ncbi:hypothetical protein FVE85_8198 [Porphyridium purpureum]|uniref:Pentatricopeptide repeat-containing protein n=1 Tax=Porphyridium purpureum TaxID=35688 RepID=A0A5J4YMH3_PORPP|nr:hypothetical protein FVE85_8198 [Porphyridium purpureum]|eukprot:POR8217..scf295_9